MGGAWGLKPPTPTFLYPGQLPPPPPPPKKKNKNKQQQLTSVFCLQDIGVELLTDARKVHGIQIPTKVCACATNWKIPEMSMLSQQFTLFTLGKGQYIATWIVATAEDVEFLYPLAVAFQHIIVSSHPNLSPLL